MGILTYINRADDGSDRNLYIDNYHNWGNESRLLYNYKLGDLGSTLLTGFRYYSDIPTGNRDMEIMVPLERREIFNLIQKVLPIHSGIQIIFPENNEAFLQKIFSGSHRS